MTAKLLVTNKSEFLATLMTWCPVRIVPLIKEGDSFDMADTDRPVKCIELHGICLLDERDLLLIQRNGYAITAIDMEDGMVTIEPLSEESRTLLAPLYAV